VTYPGLDTHPQHERARELFDGFGGMLSFELKGGAAAAQRVIDATMLPIIAPSLGGVETLLTLPVKTSHSGMSPEDRRALGITDGLVRMSVGIEATEDITEDFEQALGTIGH
jgi:cystathionine beta-lyase/cystathionine gamma-synthase